MSDLRQYNVTYEDALKRINSVLDSNGDYYRSVHIRCVAVMQDSQWRNAISLIRVLPTTPRSVGNRDYAKAKVRLLESHAGLRYLGQLVREMPTGAITVGDESLYVGERAEFHGWDVLPSYNDYADLPGYLFQSSASSLTGMLPQEPLVDFNLPFYRDTYDAVRDWAGLREFHHISDARIGYVWLFLAECRARFEDVKSASGKLRIKVARGDRHATAGLRLTGSWSTPTGPVPIAVVGQFEFDRF